MFPAELEQDAFRASNDEFGWTRAQIPVVVNIVLVEWGFLAGSCGGYATLLRVGPASSRNGMDRRAYVFGRLD